MTDLSVESFTQRFVQKTESLRNNELVIKSFTQPVYSKALINLGTWTTVDFSLASLFGVIFIGRAKTAKKLLNIYLFTELLYIKEIPHS